jgi:hypothetical protein
MNLNLDLKRNQKVKRCNLCGNVLVTHTEYYQCRCRVCINRVARERWQAKKNGTYKPKIRGVKSKSGAYWAKHDDEVRARPFPFRFVDNAVRDSSHLSNGDFFFFDKFMGVGK